MTAAAGAVVGAAVIVVMVMTLAVEVVVFMGMDMVMLVGMGMLMGMGHAVMGVLMGVVVGMLMGVRAAGNMIVINMHNGSPLAFFVYYTRIWIHCQSIYFLQNIPPEGLLAGKFWSIM
jgi:hypothetical protein